MEQKKKKGTNRKCNWLFSIIMSIAMVATSIALPQTAQTVHAATVNAPSAGKFWTKEQILQWKGSEDGSPYSTSDELNMMSAVFGGGDNDSYALNWLVVGTEKVNGDDTLVLLGKRTMSFSDEPCYWRIEYCKKNYGASWKDSYLYSKCNDNNLINSSFGVGKDYVKKVTVDEAECYIYAPAAEKKGDTVFKVGTQNQFAIPCSYYLKVNNTFKKDDYADRQFWTRTPSGVENWDRFTVYYNGQIDSRGPGSRSKAVGVINLDLSNDLFATVAPIASSDGTIDISGYGNIRFRFLDATKIKSRVEYSGSGNDLTVIKSSSDKQPVYLCVQYKDSEGDKFYTKEITESQHITLDSIGELSSAKIWLEIKSEDKNVLYASMPITSTHSSWTYTADQSKKQIIATCGDGCGIGSMSKSLTLKNEDILYKGSPVTFSADGSDADFMMKDENWNFMNLADIEAKYYNRGETDDSKNIEAPTDEGEYTIKVYPKEHEDVYVKADFAIKSTIAVFEADGNKLIGKQYIYEKGKTMLKSCTLTLGDIVYSHGSVGTKYERTYSDKTTVHNKENCGSSGIFCTNDEWYCVNDSGEKIHRIWTGSIIEKLKFKGGQHNNTYGTSVYLYDDYAECLRDNKHAYKRFYKNEIIDRVIVKEYSHTGNEYRLTGDLLVYLSAGTNDEVSAWKNLFGAVPDIHYTGKEGTSTNLEDTTISPTTRGRYTASISKGGAVAYFDFDVIRKHEHQWSYSVENNEIVATCLNNDDYMCDKCNVPEQKETITLNTKDVEYTGRWIKESDTNDDSCAVYSNVRNTNCNPEYKFYYVGADENTNYSETTYCPKYPGTYKVILRLKNYENIEISKTFVIKKKKPSVTTTPVSAYGLVYDGNAHQLLTTMPAITNATITYAVTTVNEQPEDSAFTEDAPVATNAGKYYVYYKATPTTDTGYYGVTVYEPIEVVIAKQESATLGDNEGYTINYSAETLVASDAAIYEISSTNGATAETLPGDKVEPGKTYYVRIKETTNTGASAWKEISVPARPAAPTGYTAVAPTTTAAIDGKVIDVNTTLEYKKNDGDWYDVSGTEITGLSAGDSIVLRVKQVGANFAGEAAGAIVIPAHNHTSSTASVSKAAICMEDGFKAYSRCDCGVYYCTEDNGEIGTTEDELAAWKLAAGKIDALGHTLSYSASGNTLTASCTVCTKNATLTINAPTDASYNGLANDASISGITEWKTKMGIDAPSITYTYSTTENGTYNDVTETKNAGYYKASITCSGQTATQGYSVAKSNTVPAPTGITAVSPTSENGADGKVTGVTTSMEYQINNDTEWKAVTSSAITGLKTGDVVKVRLSETGNTFASAENTVTIPVYVKPATPSGGGNDGGGAVVGDGAIGGGGVLGDDIGGGIIDKPDGNYSETKADGTQVETVVETKKDGTKVETTTETKKDGSTKETVLEVKPDGSKTETSTETKADGTKTEIVAETKADGSVVAQAVVTEADGSKTVETKNVSSDGKESSSLLVSYEEDGTPVSAAVQATKEAVGNKMSVSTTDIKDMLKDTGVSAKNTQITLTANDSNGKEKFSVNIDSKNLNKSNLVVYALDKKGNLVMVNTGKNTAKVDKDGELTLNISDKGDFQILSKEEAKKVDKAILKTIEPAKKEEEVKEGKKIKFKLSKDCNKSNIAKITYKLSSDNVKVDKKGNIVAKSSGTTKVKATITLKNGKTKTIQMKVTVK